jgi:FKBP-type peptidyl-prolyl cis-trans isomerase SlpA
MKPRLGERVRLHYRLACAGTEIVNTFADDPEPFVLGQGEIDPRLEALVTCLDRGERVTFNLDSDQAFGGHDPTLIQMLPRQDFPRELILTPGHTADFTLPNGNVLSGTILAVGIDQVEIDFNHPLAGLPVQFEVELLDIVKEPSP